MKNGRNQNELVADLLTNLSEEVNRLRQKESEQKMTIEELANEIDQLRQANRRQQLTINRLNSEIGDLRAENTRLLNVIRLQAATQPGTVKNKRLYKFSGSTKLYLKSDCESYTQDRRHAGLFSEAEWLEWGQESGLQKEAIGEDEQMKLVGAPTLPGLEL